MAWNEPGGNGKDPWSGRRGDQGPPDLDEVVRKLQDKLGGLFGGKGPRGSGSGSSDGPVIAPEGGGPSTRMIGVLGAVLLVLWMASSIYIVEPAERGVVLRFGSFATVTEPGPHWHIPFPVEKVIKVNVDQLSSFRHNAEMLTRDENIVDIEFTVQSRIQDPADYLFQDQTPDKTLRDATSTIVREIIGKSNLDFILTEGRGAITVQIKDGIQSLLEQYRTGLIVTSVNMQPAKPPEEVKAAFDDAIKAREDKERLENEAEAYANEVVPQARGQAARLVADATAYREQVISAAEGEASRFTSVLAEYQKAPEVTRERLYLDTVEEVLSGSRKVIVDVQGGNNLMYLPLDKIIGAGSERESGNAGASMNPSRPATPVELTRPERPANRDRRTR